MKTCSKCNIDKSEKEFNLVRSGSDKLRAECKECLSKYRQKNKLRINKWRIEYRNRDRNKTRKQNTESRKRNKEKLHKFIKELKIAGCSFCGKIFPPEAMDFDHINKKENIEKLVF